MAEFNKLTEGEKFAWAKEFLIKFRVMQKLRPDLTEDRDILGLVAKKFYGGNIDELENCINFIENKVPITSLANVNLEPAINEYEENLRRLKREAEKQVAKEANAEATKKMEYDRQTDLRNYHESNFKKEETRQKRSARRNNIVKLSLIALAVMAVIGMGGFAGVGNAILGFISNLTSIQAVTIGLVVYAGWNKGWLKSIKGKFKDIAKAKKDKKEKKLTGLKAEKEKQEQEQKKAADEYAKARSAKTESQKAADKAKHEFESESLHISKYNRLNEFDRSLKMSEVEMRDHYKRAVRGTDSDEEKKNMDKWIEHYIASLYYGAYKGTLNSRADISALVENAKQKFKQISNPLNMNRKFSDENVRAQSGTGINKPIEEMYESI